MGSAEDAVKEKLLWNVKKEVKSGQGPPGARVPARVPGTGGGVLENVRAPAPPRRGRCSSGSWAGRGRGPALEAAVASLPDLGTAPLCPRGQAGAPALVCSAVQQLPAL